MSKPEPPDDATRIRQACWTIETSWSAMLPKAPKATTAGTIGRTQTTPLPIPVHTLDTRRQALMDLAFYAAMILDRRELATSLDADNAPQLARFITTHADWLADTEEGPEAVESLGKWARAVDHIVAPPARDAIPLGDCPLTVAVDGSAEPCGGRVRAFADRAFARCNRCGTEDTIIWWESRILGDATANVHADAIALAAHLSRVYYRIVPPSTIRSWASKGLLERHGKDDKGRTLYDRGEVVAVAERAWNPEPATA